MLSAGMLSAGSRCALMAVTMAVTMVATLAATSPANAQTPEWFDTVGYTRLATFLCDSLPDGSGVPISIVEANDDFYPDVTDSNFDDVTFTNGSTSEGSGVSIHSTSQSLNFFGNTTSVAPGANAVTVYQADNYLNRVLNYQLSNTDLPDPQDFRVQNFSWVGSLGSDANDREALRRFEYAIEADNITAVVGVDNVTQVLPTLLSHSYNAIAVGRTDGTHSVGLTHLANYGVGRSKPDIVVDRPFASSATSSLSSIATFLHSSPTVMGTAAANSQTIKALLLAGATKDEFADWSQEDSAGQWHPLDDTYGAGEVNLYNSYLSTLGGQSIGTVATAAAVNSHGWDYQNVQPGSANSLLYDIIIPEGSVAKELSIALTWNALVSSPFHTGDPIVANLNLELVDENGLTVDLDTNDFVEGLSASSVDNVEHLYLTDLAAGTYTLKVSSDDLASDFGLAWRTATQFDEISADFDEDGDVDGADFFAWQQGYGTLINASRADGDADGDGDVDSDDLAIYRDGVINVAPAFSRAIFAVPEPASLAMLLVSFLLLGTKRHGWINNQGDFQ